jgi:hypothetical protein
MEERNGVPFFRGEQFLTEFGLTIGNLLEYFATSPFYDEHSINEQARQHSGDGFESMLQTMDGTSFRIIMAQAPNDIAIEGDSLNNPEAHNVPIDRGMAIIDKVSKQGPDLTLLGRYCVRDGFIYQCPDLLSVISARTQSAMLHLREALKEVRNVFKWSPESGFQKKMAAGETETEFVFTDSELRSRSPPIAEEEGLDEAAETQLQADLLQSLLSEMGIS